LVGRVKSSPPPPQFWHCHGQFLADDLSVLTDDYRQLTVAIPERQAIPAFVVTNPTLDATFDRAALHLPDKVLNRELHRSRGYGRIDFGRVVRPPNSGHRKPPPDAISSKRLSPLWLSVSQPER
jgi:hypothetical protein